VPGIHASQNRGLLCLLGHRSTGSTRALPSRQARQYTKSARYTRQVYRALSVYYSALRIEVKAFTFLLEITQLAVASVWIGPLKRLVDRRQAGKPSLPPATFKSWSYSLDIYVNGYDRAWRCYHHPWEYVTIRVRPPGETGTLKSQ
jgi:hypothetical protein